MIDHLIGTGRAPVPGAEDILTELSRAADLGLLVANAEGSVVFVNAIACRMLRRHRNEVIGNSFLRLVPPERRMRAWRSHVDAIGGKVVARDDWLSTDDEDRPCRLSVEHRRLTAQDGAGHHLFMLRQPEGAIVTGPSPANVDERINAVADRPAGHDYFEGAPEALFVVVPDGSGGFVFEAANLAFLALSGVERTEIVGQAPDIAFAPETAAAFAEAFRRVWQSGRPMAWTGEVGHHDCRRQWQTRLAPVSDGRGRVVRLQGSARDVTDELAAQQKLKETQDLLASIFDIADIGISVSDEQARIVRVNRSYAEIFGYEQDELIGRDILGLVSDLDRPQVEKRKALILSGVPVPPREVKIKRPNGSYRSGSAVSRLFVSSAGEKLMVTAVTDLTRQKRLEQELREREERLLAIADNMPALIGLIDGEGRIAFVNALMQGWLTQIGDPDTAPIGRTLAEAAPPKAYRAFARHIARVLQGQHVSFQQPVSMTDGTRRHFRFNLIPRTIDDRASGFFLFGFDVTAIEETKEQLRQAKDRAEAANDAKSQFLANMSHELRTPLNAIIGFSDIMANEILGPIGNAVYRSYTEDILKSGHHLHELINDVLDLSKIEAGQFELYEEELEIAQVIEAAQRIVQVRADQAGVAMVVVPMDKPWRLIADPRAMRQMLINLLSNAVKFTPSAGTVTIAARPTDDAFVVEVADTGIGIPADKLLDVTKPFYQIDNVLTRRHQGTGIGLSITDTLMKLHGGTLRLSSRESSGTTATLVFPLSRLRV